jgi:hypothetical protein
MPGRILVDFAPLRESRDFRWLFSGTLISTLGAQLTVVAIPYQVYELTHSSFQVGAVSVVQLIPLVVGSLVGGAIGDAVDRRTLMIVSTGLLALTSGALAVNSLVADPSLLAIYLVSAVAAALNGFVSTARLASIPALVDSTPSARSSSRSAPSSVPPRPGCSCARSDFPVSTESMPARMSSAPSRVSDCPASRPLREPPARGSDRSSKVCVT